MLVTLQYGGHNKVRLRTSQSVGQSLKDSVVCRTLQSYTIGRQDTTESDFAVANPLPMKNPGLS